MVLHQNRLDAVAVRQLPQVFNGTVLLGDLLPGHLGHCQDALRLQFLPQGLGEIRHLVKGPGALVEPGEHLFSPEGRLPHGFQGLRHLLEGL